MKALLRNERGEVLVVKENSPRWELPGGGIDHGESPKQALQRELAEELQMIAPFTETLLNAQTFWLESKQAWLLWLVYEIALPESFTPQSFGDTEIAFIHPSQFQQSDYWGERAIYQMCSPAPAP